MLTNRSLLFTLFVFFTYSASTNTLLDGLRAYYPLDGDANDLSGNGNHGTISGATLTTDRSGNPNSAYQFDGINDFINIGNGVKPPFPLTVGLWFKADQLRFSSLFRNDAMNDARNRYGLNLLTNGGGQVSTNTYEGFSAPWNRRTHTSVDPVYTVGEWNHYTVVVNGNTNREMYWNGILINGTFSGSGSTMLYSSGGNGALGLNYRNSTPIHAFFGSLDNVTVHSRALSAEEVRDLVNFNPGAAICDSDVLSPVLAFNLPNTPHTVTTTLRDSTENPLANEEVIFEVVSGPNSGVAGAVVTDTNGEADFTYTGDGGIGTDEIVATCSDGSTSNTASKVWGNFRADLDLLTVCRPIPPCPNGTVRCDVHVKNLGPDTVPQMSVEMELTDDIRIQPNVDPLMVFSSTGNNIGAGQAPSVAPQRVEWLATNVPAGGKTATWFTLDVGEAGGDKIVTAIGGYPDPNPGNDKHVETIIPIANLCPPDTFVQKGETTVRGRGELCLGEEIFYLITFKDPLATSADIVDTLDSCLDPDTVSALMPEDACTIADSTITCTGISLDASGMEQVSFAVQPRNSCPVETDILNEVVASFDNGVTLNDATINRLIDCALGCGDGIVEPELGEECEPPDTANCNAECRLRYCGDGNLDLGEECDDANNTDGDGCSAVCVIEPPEPLRCDIDSNGVVDIADIRAIAAARNNPAAPGDARDVDGDGVITVNDARQCVLQCTNPRCAP